jgi:MraZ protein
VGETQEHGSSVEPPRGIYSTRVDDKGRLKLPRDFENFLKSFPEQSFFVTSLDGRIARIYPMPVWRQNEKFFEESQDEPETTEDVAFFANVWGAASSLDGQGRILVPPDLRRELKIENQQVWVAFYKSAVEIYNEAVYAERRQRAADNLQQKLGTLRKKGLK